MNRLSAIAAIGILAIVGVVAQPPKPKTTRHVTATGTQPKFKAIFEPVNYPHDSDLHDVVFVSRDIGWVVGSTHSDAGDGGVLLHTTDGGDHWNAQVGDPHSGTREFEKLFFLDATHGWATEAGGGVLLKTTDGENWETVNSSFSPWGSFVFTTPDVGLYLDGQNILRSQDGGRSWNQVYACRARVQVDGLAREEVCKFQSIHFPTPQIGYASTGNLANHASAIAKTVDGGLTWNLVGYMENASAMDRGLFFSDANTGFARTYQGNLLKTADGGLTWKGATTAPAGPIRFANHDVGWVARGTTIAYTADGGKRWNTAEVRFPAQVFSSSFPTPDRGYVVGEHGMIYRYRIVPFDYKVSGMISAPAIAAH